MRRKGEGFAAQVFESIGRPLLAKEGYVYASLILDWRHIVGEQLAGQVRPKHVRFPPGKRNEGSLTLEVNPGAVLLVQHMESALIEKINTYYGYQALRRLHLIQVPFSNAAQNPKAPRAGAASPTATKKTFQPDVSDIQSPELREALQRLAAVLPE
ncbi:MAG: DUF721 domain-containing protein [Holosporales bacterium]